MIVLLLLLGFPIALVLAWSFDITPEGVRRAERAAPAEKSGSGEAGAPPLRGLGLGSSRAAGLVGLGVLIALIGFGGYHVIRPPAEHSADTAAAAGARHAIAVLPFTNMAGGDENEYFADASRKTSSRTSGWSPTSR